MHDLLFDPLIGVRTASGPRHLNLPDLLSALCSGQIDAYTGLRPHQCDPWHVFLVQIAASIRARTPNAQLPADAAYWRDGLLDLADGEATAWSLIVDDVRRPAFLQHPWKSWTAEAADYGVLSSRGKETHDLKAATPDELDILVTSKNHDVKIARIGADAAESWLYALLLLQTTSGVLGAGNYGIVRMNSGTGSRCVISMTRSLHPSQRFVDELQAIQQLRATVCEKYQYVQRGIVLSWLTCWDRNTHQHQLRQLEPWFVEAARPIRLRSGADGAIFALGANSKARQLGPKTVENGDVGDPWTPLNVEDKKKGQSALTLSSEGFSPRRLTDLLFEQGFKLTDLQRPTSGPEPGWFVASCLVRGQGTTKGFHRIELPIPPKARMALFNRQSRDTLAHLAQHLLSDAKDVQRALETALTVLVEGGPDKADFDRDAVKGWVERMRSDFKRRWEAGYFEALWRGADEAHTRLRSDWQQDLVNRAQLLLDAAAMRYPSPSNRYWRATMQAQSALRGMLHKQGLPMPSAHTAQSIDAVEEIAE